MSDALRAELARVASRLGADGVEFVLERPRDAGHGDLAPPTWPWCSPAASAPTRGRPPSACSRSCGSARAGRADRDRRPRLHQLLAGADQLAAGAPTDPREGRVRRGTTGAGLKVNVEFVSANPDRPAPRRPRARRSAGRRDRGIARVDGPPGDSGVLHQRRRRPDRPARPEPVGTRLAPAAVTPPTFPRAATTATTSGTTRREVLGCEGPRSPSCRKTRASTLPRARAPGRRAEQDGTSRRSGVRFRVMLGAVELNARRVEPDLELLAERGLTLRPTARSGSATPSWG